MLACCWHVRNFTWSAWRSAVADLHRVPDNSRRPGRPAPARWTRHDDSPHFFQPDKRRIADRTVATRAGRCGRSRCWDAAPCRPSTHARRVCPVSGTAARAARTGCLSAEGQRPARLRHREQRARRYAGSRARSGSAHAARGLAVRRTRLLRQADAESAHQQGVGATIQPKYGELSPGVHGLAALSCFGQFLIGNSDLTNRFRFTRTLQATALKRAEV